MHFRGHSRRIAPFLPPFVVYYRHRAVLCSICHSRNSYRAENRPVTANRAVFCFLRVRVVHGSFQRICGAIRAQNRPKRAKRGTLNTDTALQADRGAGILARQACDQGTGHPRMEPAEKAGSGEITIAISRSILSNKRSKAVRRMPDGLAAFRYFKIGLTACALSVCALRSHPHSPFCRCATSSPGAGEVFPQRERQEHCRKLPHYI